MQSQKTFWTMDFLCEAHQSLFVFKNTRIQFWLKSGLANARLVHYTCAYRSALGHSFWNMIMNLHAIWEMNVGVVKVLAIKGFWKHKAERLIQNRIHNEFKVWAVLILVLSDVFSTACGFAQYMMPHPKTLRNAAWNTQFRFEIVMSCAILQYTKASIFYRNTITWL